MAKTVRAVFDGEVLRPESPVDLEPNATYVVTIESAVAPSAGIWSGYDPARVRAGLRKSAGAFRGLDREAFLADMREQRQQESTGRPA